ncbi:thiamine phosphate synthase [Bacillaceae bacterium]
MGKFALHLISSGKQTLQQLEAVVREVGSYIDAFHLREKERTAAELLTWGETLARRLPREKLIVNDRLDVALALRARGVHLAHHSLPPSVARPLTSQLIGASVHSVEEAIEKAQQGADYLLFGHVFATPSKPGLPPKGIGALRQVVEAVGLPVLAVGGITAENLPEVLQTGCAGVAVISSVLHSPSPGEAAKRFRELLDAFPASPRYGWP